MGAVIGDGAIGGRRARQETERDYRSFAFYAKVFSISYSFKKQLWKKFEEGKKEANDFLVK